MHYDASVTAYFRELNEEIKITVINDDRDIKRSLFCHPGQTREWKNLWVNPWVSNIGYKVLTEVMSLSITTISSDSDDYVPLTP